MELNRNEKMSAVNYSIYMIASSYFNSAKCVNESRESKNRMLYLLSSVNEQYRMEDAAIALMEKSVFKFLPRPFVSAAVKVDFLVQNRGVRISALGYQLDIHPVKVGREILLSYEYQDLMEGTAVRYAPEIKRKKMHYGALGRLIA